MTFTVHHSDVIAEKLGLTALCPMGHAQMVLHLKQIQMMIQILLPLTYIEKCYTSFSQF